jgi:alkanesulfonate monooxygenase SsuD/methylene tetrahydromethanopterin reductase-like flavin-dependent oxidoreductase (luciferase family)
MSPLDTVKTQFDRVRAALDAAGRPADSMTYSVSYPVCTGRDDAEISRRASAIDPELGDLHPLVAASLQLRQLSAHLFGRLQCHANPPRPFPED